MLSFFLRPRVLTILGFIFCCWLLYLFLVAWTPSKVIAKKQEKLFEYLSRKKWRKAEPLLSWSYHDQWEFNKADVLLALEDVGSQFFILYIEKVNPLTQIDAEAGAATVSMRVRLQGSGTPLAQLILSQANSIQEPFTFHWSKESWWPTSWRIIRIENPGIPDTLYGYRPGDLRKQLDGLQRGDTLTR